MAMESFGGKDKKSFAEKAKNALRAAVLGGSMLAGGGQAADAGGIQNRFTPPVPPSLEQLNEMQKRDLDRMNAQTKAQLEAIEAKTKSDLGMIHNQFEQIEKDAHEKAIRTPEK